MRIWIDADACPVPVKDIVITAATRRHIETVFVANKPLTLPASPYISSVKVALASDAADLYIQNQAQSTDLVITQDIPLAHALVSLGITVINPHGKKFTPDNVGEHISMRNLMQDLRDSGEITGGPKPFGDKDKRAFAATFDRELTRLLKKHLPN